AHLLNRSVECLKHARLVAVAVELLDHTDLHALQVTVRAFTGSLHNRSNRTIHGGRIKSVVACDNLVQKRGIQNSTSGWATLIQGGRTRNQTVTGYGSVGWLHTNSVGQRSWLTDGSTSVSTNRKWRLTCSKSSRRATTRTTCGALQIPRIVG